MASVPRSFDLTEPLASLPDNAQQTLVTIRPDNNTQFTPQQIITCSLGQRGWLDPKSLSIRYKVTINNGGTATANSVAMIGCPVYTPFQRLNEYCGGQTISSVNAYNQTCQALVSGSYSVSAKYGLQNCFGYGSGNGTGVAASAADAPDFNPSNPNFDGRIVKLYEATSTSEPLDSFYVSAPLMASMLASSEKMIPLFAVPQLRIELTLDAISNMFYGSGASTGAGLYSTPSTFIISNFELVYSMIDLGAEVERYTLASAPQLKIKTMGYNNSSVVLPSGTSGSTSLVFNQRYQSIKSAFILPSSTNYNKWCDFLDVTNGGLTTNATGNQAASTLPTAIGGPTVAGGGGDYQLIIGNMSFPQAPLSTVLNRAGILQETRRAFGCLFDADNNNSINTCEFSANINYVNSADAAFRSTTAQEPGKFIVGVDLDKVAWSDRTLMSGVSTFGTSISVNINVGAVATNQIANVGLLLCYDAIMVIDTAGKQMSVRS
ncbi:MAG: hypothetical protein EBR82_27750 [Caulobacteraceae bacterium]|nr:hypothetical protein [Caulobacteraceae bacterium]